MEQILQAIKAKIEECKRKGDTFSMPTLDREDVVIDRRNLDPTGSILFHEEYDIRFQDDKWISIDSQSRDKCRTFQINPDRSYVTVRCSDSSKDFVDSWNENV